MISKYRKQSVRFADKTPSIFSYYSQCISDFYCFNIFPLSSPRSAPSLPCYPLGDFLSLIFLFILIQYFDKKFTEYTESKMRFFFSARKALFPFSDIHNSFQTFIFIPPALSFFHISTFLKIFSPICVKKKNSDDYSIATAKSTNMERNRWQFLTHRV